MFSKKNAASKKEAAYNFHQADDIKK